MTKDLDLDENLQCKICGMYIYEHTDFERVNQVCLGGDI